MTAIQRHEITPGLCAFLDTAVLADRADSLCSPHVAQDRITFTAQAVPFLVLQQVLPRKAAFCLPLTTHRVSDDQEMLDDAKKMRGGTGWQARQSFFYLRDGWLIPNDTFVRATHVEKSSTQERMRYARRHPQELDRLRERSFDDLDRLIRVWTEPTVLPLRERTSRHYVPTAVGMSRSWGAPAGYGWIR